jgi:hypothetical protein
MNLSRILCSDSVSARPIFLFYRHLIYPILSLGCCFIIIIINNIATTIESY